MHPQIHSCEADNEDPDCSNEPRSRPEQAMRSRPYKTRCHDQKRRRTGHVTRRVGVGRLKYSRLVDDRRAWAADTEFQTLAYETRGGDRNQHNRTALQTSVPCIEQ